MKLPKPKDGSKWRYFKMGSLVTERICNVCGYRAFASRNCPCPRGCTGIHCDGILCRVVTPVAGKRLSGILYRDKLTDHPSCREITLVVDGFNPLVLINGIWTGRIDLSWSREKWQKEYGKLPRKGSKEAVILELTNGQ